MEANYVFLDQANNISAEEINVFLILERLFKGLAEKDRLVLDEIIADDSELFRLFSPEKENKYTYITNITSSDNKIRRNLFRYKNVTIEVYDNSALALGTFFNLEKPFNTVSLHIYLSNRNGRWLITGNRFL
ncbi:hypothetical protein A3A20_00370 [Candidatus Wolfebacteria bacterium RIFCSPLOWO2_01_FULL_45_19]|uniref:DUF4440 domain-containing protein n=1 Tax=Candidatus Wolfebacteria bacterium RIFCSPLOWO2_01_FULL_45_19 TaxID=1802557 RepID=A0A1F8DTA5_9BACT|nr:MAG: hypothetical protein A3A20_00370 [Candidatus Wolfebacteria bacterium RIFCSPLOWO2_01_FULL_45_19]